MMRLIIENEEKTIMNNFVMNPHEEGGRLLEIFPTTTSSTFWDIPFSFYRTPIT